MTTTRLTSRRAVEERTARPSQPAEGRSRRPVRGPRSGVLARQRDVDLEAERGAQPLQVAHLLTGHAAPAQPASAALLPVAGLRRAGVHEHDVQPASGQVRCGAQDLTAQRARQRVGSEHARVPGPQRGDHPDDRRRVHERAQGVVGQRHPNQVPGDVLGVEREDAGAVRQAADERRLAGARQSRDHDEAVRRELQSGRVLDRVGPRPERGESHVVLLWQGSTVGCEPQARLCPCCGWPWSRGDGRAHGVRPAGPTGAGAAVRRHPLLCDAPRDPPGSPPAPGRSGSSGAARADPSRPRSPHVPRRHGSHRPARPSRRRGAAAPRGGPAADHRHRTSNRGPGRPRGAQRDGPGGELPRPSLAPGSLTGAQTLLLVSGTPHVLLRNSWCIENCTAQLPVYLEDGMAGAARDGRASAATRADYAEAAAQSWSRTAPRAGPTSWVAGRSRCPSSRRSSRRSVGSR